MGSKLILPIFLFIALLIGGSYYYVCKIKGVCIQSSATIDSSRSDSSTIDKLELSPLSFRFNSAEPLMGLDFDNMRDNLLNKLGDSDTLIIYGKYFKGEENGEQLGMDRALNVHSLFVDNFDPNRLIVRSVEDDMTSIDRYAQLEAIQFNVATASSDLASSDNKSSAMSDNDESFTSDGTESLVEKFEGKAIIHFPPGSITKIMNSDVQDFVVELVEQLNSDPDLKVYVEGHSDNNGDVETNYQLGRKRAWVVKKMIWDEGVDPMRVITSSKGEKEPLKSNETEEGRAYNRRVEVVVK